MSDTLAEDYAFQAIGIMDSARLIDANQLRSLLIAAKQSKHRGG